MRVEKPDELMKIPDLLAEAIERIKARRYDWIVEKHEGPFR